MTDHFATGETLQSKEVIPWIWQRYVFLLRNLRPAFITIQFTQKQVLRNKVESSDVIKIDGTKFTRGSVSHGKLTKFVMIDLKLV